MAEFSKNEQALAATMDSFHWRAWLSFEDLEVSGSGKVTMVNLLKKKHVECKNIKDVDHYRLTSRGRKLLRLELND